MKVAVSACLLGVNCKYNGGNNRNEYLSELLRDHEVIPVCPERLGGLPTPRIPAEIVHGVVTNAAGEVVDEAFRLGAREALKIVLEKGAEYVVLQPRSPSCGVNRIYDGTFSGRTVPGMGVFAALASESGIRVLDPEDEEQLRALLQSR